MCFWCIILCVMCPALLLMYNSPSHLNGSCCHDKHVSLSTVVLSIQVNEKSFDLKEGI